MTSKTIPREFAVLRRYLTGHLSPADDGFKLDVGLLEAIFDEDIARRRLAEVQSADLTRDLRRRLEYIMLVFAEGCRVALRDTDMPALVEALDAVPAVYRGFAYEGAAQGLTLLDHRSASGGAGRVIGFLAGPALQYPHLAHMGVGAGPILRRRYDRLMEEMHPSYRAYAIDGYGFREGYIYRARRILQKEEPEHPNDDSRRMFNRGIARSIWFLYAADAGRVIESVASFPEERREAMWSGIGFVCVYTGACEEEDARKLLRAAAAHRSALMQGASFAAHARAVGNNIDERCEIVCRAIAGRPAADAARVVSESLTHLHAGGEPPSHEAWSRHVRRLMSEGDEPPAGGALTTSIEE